MMAVMMIMMKVMMMTVMMTVMITIMMMTVRRMMISLGYIAFTCGEGIEGRLGLKVVMGLACLDGALGVVTCTNRRSYSYPCFCAFHCSCYCSGLAPWSYCYSYSSFSFFCTSAHVHNITSDDATAASTVSVPLLKLIILLLFLC